MSDSDPEIDDIENYLPSDSQTIISPANIPEPGKATTVPPSPNSLYGRQAQLQQMHGAPTEEMLKPQAPNAQNLAAQRAQKEAIKSYHSLYPVYFDASRTRAEGRRVSSKLAVKNPLGREIVDAVSSILGGVTRIAFEPDKLHPKDWANPGRVRIQLRDKDSGKWLGGPNVKNKSHLYILVAEWLQAHPATKETPLRLRIQGMPLPEKIEPPAVPKGWKINEILPLHSPAMSGGGVSDNMFRDMMQQMQGEGGAGLPPGMAGTMGGGGGSVTPGPSSGGGEGKKKKDKKKGKA